jgi:DNA-binding beta-propeller fold protein YncE
MPAINKAFTIWVANAPCFVWSAPREPPEGVWVLNFFGDSGNTDVFYMDTQGGTLSGVKVPVGDTTPRYMVLNSGEQVWASTPTAGQIVYVSISGGV